ncbi:DUF6343 family protein [Streptomyces sp. A10(2020)]|uniref:DUF6343 family protein n=1 Tax=Streptomyces sp. A10(2020) TaxID=2782013 RepID=UPI00324264F3
MRTGRTGTEPTTARSPLRMRRALGVFGVVWTLAGVVAFALVDEPRWAALCAVLWLVAVSTSWSSPSASATTPSRRSSSRRAARPGPRRSGGTISERGPAVPPPLTTGRNAAGCPRSRSGAARCHRPADA